MRVVVFALSPSICSFSRGSLPVSRRQLPKAVREDTVSISCTLNISHLSFRYRTKSSLYRHYANIHLVSQVSTNRPTVSNVATDVPQESFEAPELIEGIFAGADHGTQSLQIGDTSQHFLLGQSSQIGNILSSVSCANVEYSPSTWQLQDTGAIIEWNPISSLDPFQIDNMMNMLEGFELVQNAHLEYGSALHDADHLL